MSNKSAIIYQFVDYCLVFIHASNCNSSYVLIMQTNRRCVLVTKTRYGTAMMTNFKHTPNMHFNSVRNSVRQIKTRFGNIKIGHRRY